LLVAAAVVGHTLENPAIVQVLPKVLAAQVIGEMFLDLQHAQLNVIKRQLIWAPRVSLPIYQLFAQRLKQQQEDAKNGLNSQA